MKLMTLTLKIAHSNDYMHFAFFLCIYFGLYALLCLQGTDSKICGNLNDMWFHRSISIAINNIVFPFTLLSAYIKTRQIGKHELRRIVPNDMVFFTRYFN